jgi:uncharacterized protein YjbI with pentapeptide repeats
MANKEHLDILMRGVKSWNTWRRRNPKIKPDLSHAELEAENFDGGDFHGVNFFGANLSGEASFCNADFRDCSFEFTDFLDSYGIGSDFRGALFVNATLSEMDFAKADFRDAELNSCRASEADFSGADLRGANLNGSDLSHANFEGAKLQGANLTCTQLIGTRFRNADLSGARVFGVTPWEVELEGATQADLVITPGDLRVTVDDLQVAQFMYLLIDNRSLRRIIDTMTARVVLVIGRFGSTRRDRLAILQDRIRDRGFVPLSVDAGKIKSKELMATATLLARMSRFVVADLTDAPQVVQILEAVVPEVAVPVLSLDSSKRSKSNGFVDAWKYGWFLDTTRYQTTAELARQLSPSWFDRADEKREELSAKRRGLYR